MTSLTYIWHDCFLFSNDDISIVFDFWKDPFQQAGKIPRFLQSLDREKPLYVVVSHHHKDHFSKQIFDWSLEFPNVRYILSKDTGRFCNHILRPDGIYKGVRPPADAVTILRPGEEFKDVHVRIEAYGSTDIGNSYALTVGDVELFHAGDLNAWIWLDESSQQEVKKAMGDFKAILDNISLKHGHFNIAMFPVDSRLGREYYTGARMFVRKFIVDHFFPMHFGLGDTSEEQIKFQLDAAHVEEYANPLRGEYICLQSPYSSFMQP